MSVAAPSSDGRTEEGMPHAAADADASPSSWPAWIPPVLAAASFLVLAALTLAFPYKLREPDPYAYRASIEALEQNDLTLTPDQYQRLDQRLREDGDGWERRTAAGAGPGSATCGSGPALANAPRGQNAPAGQNGPSGPSGQTGPGVPNAPAGPNGLTASTGQDEEAAPAGLVTQNGPNPPRPPNGPNGPNAPGGPGRGAGGPAGGGPVGVNGAAEAPAIGIAQWVRLPDGRCASEKNPGYPFLAMPFDMVGVLRFAPLFYGGLACLGLYLGASRWIGRWGGALTVALFCSPSAVLIMAHRAYMPSFTDAALLAAAAGFVLWSVLALDRHPAVGAGRRAITWRLRAIVGAFGFLLAGASVTVRYTNLVPVAVIGSWAVLAAFRRRWALGWQVLPLWIAAGSLPLVLVAVYNKIVFDKVIAAGYENAGGLPQWQLANVSHNLSVMPGRLWQAMPVMLVGTIALVAIVVGAIVVAVRPSSSGPDWFRVRTIDDRRTPERPDRKGTDRWVVPMLAGWWLSLWALYAMYGWTWQSAPPGDGSGGQFIVTTRFYLPAIGAIALLAAALLVRLPRAVAVGVVVILFVLGGVTYQDAVTGDWLFSHTTQRQPGGGPGIPAGPVGPPNGPPSTR